MPLRIPGDALSDKQSSTFLEAILLKDLVRRVLDCSSLKRFSHLNKTQAEKFHFSVSVNLGLFMNTRKAGNVYVQQATKKVVLFELSWEPQEYPSEPGYDFRERKSCQPFPKHALCWWTVHGGKKGKVS